MHRKLCITSLGRLTHLFVWTPASQICCYTAKCFQFLGTIAFPSSCRDANTFLRGKIIIWIYFFNNDEHFLYVLLTSPIQILHPTRPHVLHSFCQTHKACSCIQASWNWISLTLSWGKTLKSHWPTVWVNFSLGSLIGPGHCNLLAFFFFFCFIAQIRDKYIPCWG